MKACAAPLLAVTLALALSTAARADTGLVGDWPLDEGRGQTAADVSGHANTATLLGAPSWIAGHSGTALAVDGSGSGARVADNPSLEPATAITVSAWVQRSGSPGAYRYIVGKGATGCTAASYALYSGPNGGLSFYVLGPASDALYTRSPDAGLGVWDGAWHDVTGTFDGSVVRLYVDGREIGSGTPHTGAITYGLPDSNDLFIGHYPGCASRDFVGVIDEPRIWSRALSAAEVAAATGAGAPAPPGAGSGPAPGTAGGGTGHAPGPNASGGPPLIRSVGRALALREDSGVVVESGSRISCAPAGPRCVVSATATVRRAPVGAAGRRLAARSLTLADVRTRIVSSGATFDVRFTLNRLGAALLRRVGRLTITITVTARAGAGPRVSTVRRAAIAWPRSAPLRAHRRRARRR
jgi:hypothetical protein